MKPHPILLSLALALGATPLLVSADGGLSKRDHERARAAAARGDYVPLERIIEDAERREGGKVIDVELDDDEYEIEVLRDDGVVVELEYDARNGRLLEREVEDD